MSATLATIGSAPPARRPSARPAVVHAPAGTAGHASSPTSSRSAAGATAGSLRLTRRGRYVLLGLLVVAVLTAFSMGRASGAAGASTGRAVPHTVVVAPGDTLWSIARSVAPDVDPRVEVPRIQSVNGLTGAALQAGQRLSVPDTNG